MVLHLARSGQMQSGHVMATISASPFILQIALVPYFIARRCRSRARPPIRDKIIPLRQWRAFTQSDNQV